MAFLQLRKFNFFDKETVKDPETSQIFDGLKDLNISACVSGRGQLIIGDFEGSIYMLSRELKITSFTAYNIRVSHLFQMKQSNLLISIGEDEQGTNPLIKVWNLEKLEKGVPFVTRICRAIPANKPTPVTCFTVHENLNWMAVGFENGSVVLFKGDVKSDRHSKQTVIYENPKPITGLSFKTSGKNVILFVVTESVILSINVTAKDTAKDRNVNTLDEIGCKLGCSVMSDVSQDNHFVIGRDDALYFYQPDGKGPCLAFEGEKFQLHWFRGYLVIVGKESKSFPKVPMIRSGHNMDMHIVTVYDIQNKFIAYTAPYPDVIDVVSEWGSLYIIAGDRKVYQLQEKDTQTKLEMLFNKKNYTLAISLAKSQQYDQDGLIDIFTQYGDHLYKKGDHDGAIDQYIKTIGKLEASYVIRKFLDAQRIHNLTKYLQALHTARMATEEHTTLLLNCYTKLKDVSKLDEFIMTKDREVDFNVETAIKVCRQAGYYKHALFLANKHQLHEWYLKIQLDDIKDYQKALEYIGKLEFAEAEENLKKYGKMFMAERPQETTELLKRLCTDYKPTDRPLVEAVELEGSRSPGEVCRAPAEQFIHIFVNNSAKLIEFLEHMISVYRNSPSLLYNTLIELYLHENKQANEKKILDILKNPEANYDLDQALVLCQMNNFKAGILCLYEKARLYQQILRYHMDCDAHDLVIQTCKTYGTQDTNLWVQALSYFSKKENLKSQLGIVLQHIDKMNLLPPLLVIQTLAHSSTATLSVIKNYVIRKLQSENEQIAEDERLIKQYQDDTEKKRQQIEELKSTAKIFQNTKCSVCHHPLDLPTVHFLCEPHSFHQHCFESYAESDTECPVCSVENRKIMDMIRAQEHGRDLHETFHNQLERAPDGFSVVADYFGRGVFNKVTVITDSPARLASVANKYSS
ncbi:vacuolar protein sorting-associated protein 11 homolog [Ruditapes philippinarum]|uniref:vacuolar protein sorting-associated protein 11 homolog n=1 Tax=Ruditapes philippinarum TaxID=129788 RepID=UPI00295BF0BC|nr:vacuolar protein sorting-associated protein 11 homolog [Ruditapes philippinarum]